MTDRMFTVFLVDDDAGVLKALSHLLRMRGYDIQSFTSPQAFLTGHDASIPGCAVFDLALPGLDGIELQQALTAGADCRRSGNGRKDHQGPPQPDDGKVRTVADLVRMAQKAGL
jgi:CheY-like chemotaxis protein